MVPTTGSKARWEPRTYGVYGLELSRSVLRTGAGAYRAASFWFCYQTTDQYFPSDWLERLF